MATLIWATLKSKTEISISAKLCLKDNGTNTEEIRFLVRQFEQARSQMLATKDFGKALTIFFNLLQDTRVHPLMEKYGLR